MKKLFLASAALVALNVGSSAFAADMPVKARRAPPPPPVYSWTGFYVGVNAGYGRTDTSADIVSSDPASAGFLNQQGILGPAFSGSFASSFHQKGWIAGLQAGYNWQFAGNWVGGFETDIQYARITGSFFNRIFFQPGAFGTSVPFDLSSERRLEWFGTVRGRLGVLLFPNLLVYGTAGLAYGHTQASASIVLQPQPGGGLNAVNNFAGGLLFVCEAPGAGSACYAGSDSRTSVGWAAGAGFEFNVWGNVTAKLEYLHVDLGGQTVKLISPSPPSSPGVFIDYGFNRERVDIVRAGLNYRFDWGKTPVAVMAKY
jgi:outer membrane immunogenic protein